MKILTHDPNKYLIGMCDRCFTPIVKDRGYDVYTYREPILPYGEFLGRICMKCINNMI